MQSIVLGCILINCVSITPEGIGSAHEYKLDLDEISLSTPFITRGKPFSVLIRVKNSGSGDHQDREFINLHGGPLFNMGREHSASVKVGHMAGKESKNIRVDGLSANLTGDVPLTVEVANFSQTIDLHVFPEEPSTPLSHSEEIMAVVESESADIRAVVSNQWSRLCFIEDDGYGYAIAETWNGERWQRVGTMYPLARVIIEDKGGKQEELKVRVRSFEAKDDKLTIGAFAYRPEGISLPLTIEYRPEHSEGRIYIKYQLQAEKEVRLLAFYGPSMLAGDRAYGARKDFAIFPGLEYLQGDEESSSERDLAYPLSDRRVPAFHKVTTPLMAVQAEDSLTALMWDANQEWAKNEKYPSARFLAPKYDSGYEHIQMSLFLPSVGRYVRENSYFAEIPYLLKEGDAITLSATLVLDHRARYPKESMVNGPHKGALVLQAFQHWFDVYGFPKPSSQPRDWDSERALCRDAYFSAVWSEDPPGWRHCHGWEPGLFVGHAVPQLLDIREGVSDNVRREIERRIALVIDRAIREQGKHYLWSGAGCHIMMGELPFYYGYLGESLNDMKRHAYNRLANRENGLWVWRPHGNERHKALGVPGDHTLGQVAPNALLVLRSARFTGDPELIKQALSAIPQMELYEIPRGAQTWECPLYQPDILAAAYAIRAYCEAYRLTGDEKYLENARYWGLTGLPFIYMWAIDSSFAMLYNVVSVIGSTFYTHSWLGLPVIWCGLVYAYGLLDLAEFDSSFDWRRIAQGITNSAILQQYTSGRSKGCYPDSWNVLSNKPNPADINPENILVNSFRLRGMSPEPRFARIEKGEGFAFLNSAGDISNLSGSVSAGRTEFQLKSAPGFSIYSIIAPVDVPKSLEGSGKRVENSDQLQEASEGWLYDSSLNAVIMKTFIQQDGANIVVLW